MNETKVPVTPGTPSGNMIDGRVTVRGSNVGIPGLIVSAYDLNSCSPITPSAGSPGANGDGDASRPRLGSAITGRDGDFLPTYVDQDYQDGERGRRPNVAIAISPPERGAPSTDEEFRPIWTDIRRSAGRVETFAVAVDEAWLDRAEISAPGGPRDQARASADKRDR